MVGPFWLSIGMALQILTMGLVFGLIFKTDLADYLPFLAISIIIWGLISSSINEGCMTFVSSEAMIKQLNLPHYLFVVRTVWRNLVTAAHNLVILPAVLLIFWRFPGWQLIALFPGIFLIVFNLCWVVWLIGIISARYRDMAPIISSLVTIAFYLTPVMWYPTLIENNLTAHLLLGLNPIYHWIQVVRLPLLGTWPTWENWGLASLSAGIGWGATFLVYRKYKNMIAYWV